MRPTALAVSSVVMLQGIMTCSAFSSAQALLDSGTQNSYLDQYRVDEYIKMPDLETVFSGASSPMTIADISTGALYVYFRAYNQSTGVSEAQFTGNARLRYTD